MIRNVLKKKLESSDKKLGQEQSRCKEMEIQYKLCVKSSL